MAIAGPSGTVVPSSSGLSHHKILVIVLSSVLSVVGLLAAAGLMFLCCRHRRRGSGLFPRGISPIDDTEIETWKGHHPLGTDDPEMAVFSKETAVDSSDEPHSPPLLSCAGTFDAGGTVHHQDGHASEQPHTTPHARGVPLDSAGTSLAGVQARPKAAKRTLSNVIVYKEPTSAAALPHRPSSSGASFSPPTATLAGVPASSRTQQHQQDMPMHRRSEEMVPRLARSASFSGRGLVGRFSSDQGRDFLVPLSASSPSAPTALQHARAPNARAGLTDEAVPGDPSFLPPLPLKRQPSRTYKPAPAAGPAPHRKSSSLSSSSWHSGLMSSLSSPHSSSNSSSSSSATSWHARTRSTRSSSTISGRSYAGSDAVVGQPFGLPHLRRPSQAQLPYCVRPPPPALDRASHSRQASAASSSSPGHINRDYLSAQQQPRTATMSPIPSIASTSRSPGPHMDDGDGPLGEHTRGEDHAQVIGRAIG